MPTSDQAKPTRHIDTDTAEIVEVIAGEVWGPGAVIAARVVVKLANRLLEVHGEATRRMSREEIVEAFRALGELPDPAG